MRRRLSLAVLVLLIASMAIPRASVAAVQRSGGKTSLRVVPRIGGVRIDIGGHVYRTDRMGRIGVHPNDLSSLDRLRIPRQRVRSFAVEGGRWFGGSKIGLNIYRRVRFEFTDRNGKLLETHLLTSMVVRSSIGELIAFEGPELSQAHWLFSRRVVSTQERVIPRQIDYSIQEVRVRGANVVNTSQQRFAPDVDPSVRVSLLFYPSRFSVRDALFGFPIGSSLRLSYPDGSVATLPLDAEGNATAPALPRGEYQVTVDGPGVALSAPVAITRAQDAQIIFLSYLDIGVALAVAALFLIGLPVIGRTMRHRQWRLMGNGHRG